MQLIDRIEIAPDGIHILDTEFNTVQVIKANYIAIRLRNGTCLKIEDVIDIIEAYDVLLEKTE